MTHPRSIPGFVGLTIAPRDKAISRDRAPAVSLTDLTPDEWRIIALADDPETRRSMAGMIVRSLPGAGKAPRWPAR